MRNYIMAAALLGGISSIAMAQNTDKQSGTESAPKSEKIFPSPNAIVDAADTFEWVAIKPSDLMVMDLAPDRDGKKRRVIIQLMPEPFSQGWIRNIRKLADAKFWDDTAVIRVQDNYVTQWGDPNGGEEGAKALPDDLETVPETSYFTDSQIFAIPESRGRPRINYNLGAAFFRNAMIASGEWPDELLTGAKNHKERLKKDEISTPSDNSLQFAKKNRSHNRFQLISEFINNDSITQEQRATILELLKPDHGDRYAEVSAHLLGWPIASNNIPSNPQIWPVHCYGMVGVGRDLSPNTGDGSSLYTVIGHAPRHLDRNIALVGRIISGMEYMSSLPRGTGDLGFYETPEERTKITSVRMGNDVSDTPTFEYLSTESDTFAKYADARANRRDPFFNVPAGGADICNIPVPIREKKEIAL